MFSASLIATLSLAREFDSDSVVSWVYGSWIATQSLRGPTQRPLTFKINVFAGSVSDVHCWRKGSFSFVGRWLATLPLQGMRLTNVLIVFC